MSNALATDARVLGVLVVSGPSGDAFFELVKATEVKWRIGILASEMDSKATAFVVERLAPDPAEITKQIKAIADNHTVDHLIIKCDPETPAIAYASLFGSHDDAGHALTDIARLVTTILVISPSALLDSLLSRCKTEGLLASCFMAEQVEFAGDILLNGIPDSPEFEGARAIASTLNPRARVSELSGESLKAILANTGTSFDFAGALEGAGWRKLIDAEERPPGNDASAAFAYRARKPFHPGKFWELLHRGFAGVFRAKGFFWLATRHDHVGGLNLAGSEFQVAPAGKWWAARDENVRADMPERTAKEWKEPFGDRRQAIALMGIDCDANRLKAQLDACLLTDSEIDAGEESWRHFSDPFPPWSGHSHEHECNHNHEAGDHECCHH